VKPLLANLAGGDRLIFTPASASDLNNLVRRRNGIALLAPNGVLGETVFTRDQAPEPIRPHTLCELIADAYGKGPMLIPNPDFTHIIIHRLSSDSGDEKEISVNLADLVEKGAQPKSSDSVEAKIYDLDLNWGDLVEIGVQRALDEKSWTRLDPETAQLLSNALTRRALVKLSENDQFHVFWTPEFRSFSWAGEIPSENSDRNFKMVAPGGSSAETIITALRANHIDLEKLSRVDVHSGDKTRQISIEELRKSDPKFQDGDVIEPVLR
jgi:hypothetical protein